MVVVVWPYDAGRWSNGGRKLFFGGGSMEETWFYFHRGEKEKKRKMNQKRGKESGERERQGKRVMWSM